MEKRVRMNANSPELDLIDSINDFRIDDADKLTENIRKTSKQIIYMDQIFRSSINEINKITDINYPNYIFDKSLYFGARPYENLLMTSLSTPLEKLDMLRIGY
jgi:hypothetical protein